MLSLNQVDLELLSNALEDHSPTMQWWLDPQSGEVIPEPEDLGSEQHLDADPSPLVAVEPIDSRDAYGDMEDFIAGVREPRARELLGLAIAGRGAFRRFKDTLFEFPELREEWHAFHDARMRRRALNWLVQARLADSAEVDEELRRIDALAESPTPAPDAQGIARAVADDLRRLYGERLRHVLLFGSWARGDAAPDSDVDLLVVLDTVEHPWHERRRMDEILWRHSFEGDAVVTALPLGEADFDHPAEPVVIRAREEGLEIE